MSDVLIEERMVGVRRRAGGLDRNSLHPTQKAIGGGGTVAEGTAIQLAVQWLGLVTGRSRRLGEEAPPTTRDKAIFRLQ